MTTRSQELRTFVRSYIADDPSRPPPRDPPPDRPFLRSGAQPPDGPPAADEHPVRIVAEPSSDPWTAAVLLSGLGLVLTVLAWRAWGPPAMPAVIMAIAGAGVALGWKLRGRSR